MGWLEEYRRKLSTPKDLAKLVKSGDRVLISPGAEGLDAPFANALAERGDELEGVSIQVLLTMQVTPQLAAAAGKAFELEGYYFSEQARRFAEEGKYYYVPISFSYSQKALEERGGREIDVLIVPTSSPDENGYCSFGGSRWWCKEHMEHAKVVIAEVMPGAIRTGGDNSVHVSELDYFLELPLPKEEPGPNSHTFTPGLREDEITTMELIGEITASDLIRDGDTLQFGAGTLSQSMTAYLHGKHDLGVHTESLPSGVVSLVKEGVVTGKKKTLHPGKVVASGAGGIPEEAAFIDGNPMFELYAVSYTNNIRTLIQIDNLVAINTALTIDLTGQVTAESFGPRVWTGAGGQLDFVVGALGSRGGRSITLIQSTAKQGTISRIVPMLEQGTGVTVPRQYVDYVVTEHGWVNLMDKNIKQRAEALISIAHPDFRSDLRKQAQKIHHI